MSKRNYAAKQGVYQLQNPSKYNGPLTEGGVLYRSSWESRVFYYMDHNVNVIEWSSEGLVIPYIFALDGKPHRYYPDVVCKVNTKDGIKIFVIEVKPAKQTMEPTKPKNRSLARKKRYETEMVTYVKNTNKWEATQKYCEKNGYEFKIFTEAEIFGRQR